MNKMNEKKKKKLGKGRFKAKETWIAFSVIFGKNASATFILL